MADAVDAPKPLRTPWVLAACSFIAYGYFFQGFGWNPNSHYATIRSLVERGTADITPFTDITGDVSRIDGRIVSNKPPGFPLLGAPFYFVIEKIVRARGLDINDTVVAAHVQHLLTVFLCALPATVLVVLVYGALLRGGANRALALGMGGAFAFGSLVWPYTGLLMSHVMTAALLFGAWYLVTGVHISTSRAALVGAVLGVGSLCDFLVAPAVILTLLYLVWRRPAARALLTFLVGPAVALIVLILYNRWAYGRFVTAGVLHTSQQFQRQGMALGMFQSPEWARLYWISFHPMRGMFVVCPMLLVSFLGLLKLFEGRWRDFCPSARRVLAILIIVYFVLFELSFFGWTGGYATGIRYFIPILAFVWLFAPAGFRALPAIASLLIAVSIGAVLAVTSVMTQVAANDSGPPVGDPPLWVAIRHLMNGRVSQGEQAYNLGMMMGLRGPASLLPVIGVVIAFWLYVGWVALRSRAAAPANASEAESPHVV
jgi:hypothetical protein